MNNTGEENTVTTERKFESISDFFLNATEEQKRKVFLSVLQQANNAQRKVMEQSAQSRQKR
ncbi:hypothetical protein QWY20_01095 [Alkalimonas sp. MEB108]|uniref:Uncharacterized protein n=1 Tax=Alkalimonas cellulosilytica TaxID=3058395 RepID=A0ABU7J112_9GAMM|nr:hypothetical protein [Alkalimonas sp. MEB108]MEE2000033.1 hypothetical protein [Alkalimonas sp. MEB108]